MDQDAPDDEILTQLKTRKEMRKGGGLVKYTAASAESRRANVEGEWPGLKEAEASEDESEEVSSEEEDVEMNDAEDSEEDSDEDAEEDESMEEPIEDPKPILSGKLKRADKKSTPVVRPAKKVAFAADPKQSKQARSASGATQKKAVMLAKVVAKKPTVPTATVKVANVPSGKKTATLGREEAYDFGKFF